MAQHPVLAVLKPGSGSLAPLPPFFHLTPGLYRAVSRESHRRAISLHTAAGPVRGRLPGRRLRGQVRAPRQLTVPRSRARRRRPSRCWAAGAAARGCSRGTLSSRRPASTGPPPPPAADCRRSGASDPEEEGRPRATASGDGSPDASARGLDCGGRTPCGGSVAGRLGSRGEASPRVSRGTADSRGPRRPSSAPWCDTGVTLV